MPMDGSLNNLINSNVNIALSKHKTPSQLTTTLGISKNFIGREKELKTINEKLSSSNSLLLINGIGGVGKSAIASHYLQSNKDKFNYYGFFEGLDSLVSELKKPLDIKAENQGEAFSEMLWKLRELTGSKLLVIDDIKKVEEQEETITKILALKEQGYQILFTSREEIDKDSVASFYLELLELDDAKALFNTIYPVDDDPLLEEILGYLDCHTLFIELTAKTLQQKKTVTLQDLKDKFEKGEFSKVSIRRRESFGKYLNQLFNFELLDDEEISVLTHLAVLPAIEVPFDTLQAVFKPDDDEEFEEILNYLSEKGWLNRSDDSYKLHQIIKEYILDNHPLDFEENVVPVIDHIIAVEQSDSRILYIEIIKSLYAICLQQPHEKTAELLATLAKIYEYIGDYKNGVIYQKRVVSIVETLKGDKDSQIATAYNDLGLLYDDLGNYAQAFFLHQKALNIREKTLGVEHPDTARSYNNLAGLYNVQGDYAQALPLFKKALAINEKILGEEHPDTATSYNNLAGLYRVQGDYTQALPLYKKALAIREKTLGEEHPYTATSYNNLAIFYKSQGDYAQALPLYKKALAIREKILGEEHPDTANSYHNMAYLQKDLKNCQRAKYYAEKALIAYQQCNLRKDIAEGKILLKDINWNIKKAKKLPPKRRAKFCKDF